MSDEQPESFGKRYAGIEQPILPLKAVSRSLRIAVWNRFHDLMQATEQYSALIKIDSFLRRLAIAKRWVVADLPFQDYKREELLQKWILTESQWWEVYQLVEDGFKFAGLSAAKREHWQFGWNRLLEEEGSPYRFAGKTLISITSDEELQAISTATTHVGPFEPSSEHIRNAVGLFGKRPEPDYANTAKEALLALESAVCIATGHRTGDIGGAMRAFKEKYRVHGALTQSASNLFGYGSDEGGVRHGKTDSETSVDFEDAKLVLVNASAWVNYIKQLASQDSLGN